MAVIAEHTFLSEEEEQGCRILLAIHTRAVPCRDKILMRIEYEVVLALDEDGEVVCDPCA